MKRLIATSVALSLTLITVFGCSVVESPPDSAPPATVRVGVAIDGSVMDSARTIARTAYPRLMATVEPLLQHPGPVDVSVIRFGRSGTAPVTVFQLKMPGSDHLSGILRKRRIIAARQRLSSAVRAGLGLSKQDAGFRAQSRLAGTDGSDAAGAIVYLDKRLRGKGDADRRLIVLSDLLQRGSGVDLAAEIAAGENQPDELSSRLAPLLPQDLSGLEVTLLGIGLNGRGNVSTARSLLLERAWTRALRRAGATSIRSSTTY